MGTTKEVYSFCEFFLPTMAMLHTLVIILPTQWKTNIFSYFIGMMYVLYKTHKVYGMVPSDLVAAALIST
jgi:hypothetical protein